MSGTRGSAVFMSRDLVFKKYPSDYLSYGISISYNKFLS